MTGVLAGAASRARGRLVDSPDSYGARRRAARARPRRDGRVLAAGAGPPRARHGAQPLRAGGVRRRLAAPRDRRCRPRARGAGWGWRRHRIRPRLLQLAARARRRPRPTPGARRRGAGARPAVLGPDAVPLLPGRAALALPGPAVPPPGRALEGRRRVAPRAQPTGEPVGGDVRGPVDRAGRDRRATRLLPRL